jgi:3-oxoadipate enol-lactonase
MMEKVTTDDGIDLHIEIEGAAGAPVLLLSNSLGTSLEMWAPQVEALTSRYRLVRYDSRGHGRSGASVGDYTIERLGLDAVAILDALNVPRARFCGLSMGGMVGMWLGTHAPERLERLCLANTAAWMGPPEAWQRRIEAVLRDGVGAIKEAVVERWFTPGFRARAHETVAGMSETLLITPPKGYAGCCAAIRDMDQREAIRAIFAPTLVIGGARDPATPLAKAQEIAEAIAGARLIVLDAAHLSNIEQPEAFTAALIEFLK